MPSLSLGSNQVLFGGMIPPSSDICIKSSMRVGCIAMHPTRIEDLMQISDEGGIMPPKSTWFEPKLRDGMFTHLI